MVPLTGLEPVQYRYRGILSPLCLPIPPHRRISATTNIPQGMRCVNTSLGKTFLPHSTGCIGQNEHRSGMLCISLSHEVMNNAKDETSAHGAQDCFRSTDPDNAVDGKCDGTGAKRVGNAAYAERGSGACFSAASGTGRPVCR